MTRLGKAIRSEFPAFEFHERGNCPFIYLDNAATTLRPRAVIEAVCAAMKELGPAVHRSVHAFAQRSTDAYEAARASVADWIGAQPHEIVFTRNASEGLQRIALGWPEDGKEVLTSLAEHHSNLFAWSRPVTRLALREDGQIDLEAFERALATGRYGLVALTHVSNVTGAELDVHSVAERVHAAGAVLVLDVAQSIPHRRIDVNEFDCDFLVFSGHKLCGPSGVGVLYGKADELERLQARQIGGGVVKSVRNGAVQLREVPWRFELGTPAVEAVIGLAAAIDWLEEIGIDEVERHQRALIAHTLDVVARQLPQARVLGPSGPERSGPVSITLPGVQSQIVARALADGYGVCVRAGYHCAEPLHEALDARASLRISPYLYNTREEIELAVRAIAEVAALQSV